MADIYNIPGDDGELWRIDKLIEYKQLTDYVDLSTLKSYMQKHFTKDKESFDNVVKLAWYHSLTYSEVSALWMLNNDKDIDYKSVYTWFKTYRDSLPFSSARVYCKNMGWFVPLMRRWLFHTNHVHPYEWLRSIVKDEDTAGEKYDKIYKELNKWDYMGRFSIDLFLQVLETAYYADAFPFLVKSQEPPFKWGKGSNLTSGMLNLIYEDDAANKFDKTGHLDPCLIDKLDDGLDRLYMRCTQKGLSIQSHTTIIPRICTFRNLFKGKRYVGYHQDRQLEQIQQISAIKNSDLDCIDELYGIRKTLWGDHMLGEVSGWQGIRKERKKLFLKTGRLI